MLAATFHAIRKSHDEPTSQEGKIVAGTKCSTPAPTTGVLATL